MHETEPLIIAIWEEIKEDLSEEELEIIGSEVRTEVEETEVGAVVRIFKAANIFRRNREENLKQKFKAEIDRKAAYYGSLEEQLIETEERHEAKAKEGKESSEQIRCFKIAVDKLKTELESALADGTSLREETVILHSQLETKNGILKDNREALVKLSNDLCQSKLHLNKALRGDKNLSDSIEILNRELRQKNRAINTLEARERKQLAESSELESEIQRLRVLVRDLEDQFISQREQLNYIESLNNTSVGNLEQTLANIGEVPLNMPLEYEKLTKLIYRNIPLFSGKSDGGCVKEDLERFIECSQHLLSQYEDEDEQKDVLKLIKTRLTGQAREAVKNETCDNLDELLVILKRKFIPKLKYDEVIGAVSKCKQWTGETLYEYCDRVLKTFDIARSAIAQKYPSKERAEAIEDHVQTEAIRVFKRGIKNREVRHRLAVVKLENPSLVKLIDEAENINAELSDSEVDSDYEVSNKYRPRSVKRDFYGGEQKNTSPNYNHGKSENYVQRAENSRFTKSEGQFINQDRSRHSRGNYGPVDSRRVRFQEPRRFESGRHQSIPERSNFRVFCSNCGREGHLSRDCQARPNADFCTRCRNYGHKTNSCNIKIEGAAVASYCDFCSSSCHPAENCLARYMHVTNLNRVSQERTPTASGSSRFSAATHPNRPSYCALCNKFGHMEYECNLRPSGSGNARGRE